MENLSEVSRCVLMLLPHCCLDAVILYTSRMALNSSLVLIHMPPVSRTEGLLGRACNFMVVCPVWWCVGIPHSVVQAMFLLHCCFKSLVNHGTSVLTQEQVAGINLSSDLTWSMKEVQSSSTPKPDWMAFLAKSIVFCLMDSRSARFHFLGVFLDSKSFNAVATTTNPWSEKPRITLTDLTRPGLLEQKRSNTWSRQVDKCCNWLESIIAQRGE